MKNDSTLTITSGSNLERGIKTTRKNLRHSRSEKNEKLPQSCEKLWRRHSVLGKIPNLEFSVVEHALQALLGANGIRVSIRRLDENGLISIHQIVNENGIFAKTRIDTEFRIIAQSAIEAINSAIEKAESAQLPNAKTIMKLGERKVSQRSERSKNSTPAECFATYCNWGFNYVGFDDLKLETEPKNKTIVAVVGTGVKDGTYQFWNAPSDFEYSELGVVCKKGTEGFSFCHGKIGSDADDLNGHDTLYSKNLFRYGKIFGGTHHNPNNSLEIIRIRILDEAQWGCLADAVTAWRLLNLISKTFLDNQTIIVNNSFGFSGKTSGMNESATANERKILEEAFQAGSFSNLLFVSSAGNGGKNLDDTENVVLPAQLTHENTLTVAALLPSNEIALRSNYGEQTVSIAAPGQALCKEIRQDEMQQFCGWSTSAASFYVTAAAAVLLSQSDNRLSPNQIKNALEFTSKPVAAKRRFTRTIGGGALDLAAALEFCKTNYFS
ncbi:MAG: S8 family serine peptidase [Pyrinomonadaceae bacterium]